MVNVKMKDLPPDFPGFFKMKDLTPDFHDPGFSLLPS